MSNAVSLASEETFRLPQSYKWLLLFCIIVLGAFLSWSLVLPFIESSQKSVWLSMCGVALFGSLFWYSLQVWKRVDDYIQVNGTGITYVSKRGQSTFLQWENISGIRGRFYLQRLELYDDRGQKAMNLEYQFENFDRLRQIVHENTGHLRERHALQKVFHRHAYVYSFYVVSILAIGSMAWFSLKQSASMPAIGIAGFTALAIIMLLREIRKVNIEPSAVMLVYSLWERKLPYTEISDIFLKNVYIRGNSCAAVFIKQCNGKTFKLMGFKNGEDALFDALRSAWEARIGKRG